MAKKYDLQLRGFVGGYSFDSEYISWYLDKHKGSPLTLLIESRGGQLDTGISVCSAIRDHGDISVHFVGMNASAATIASLGAKHISMACDAWYLVHKASVQIFEWASLNADQIEQRCKELEKKRAELAKFDIAISEMYSRRCKKNPKDMLALMQKETWLTAQEALEWGFIDEITDLPDDIRNEITDQVLADFDSQGIALPESLLREINGKSPSEDNSLLRKIRNLINSFKMDPNTTGQTPAPQPAAAQAAQPAASTGQFVSKQEYDALLARVAAIEGNQAPPAQQPAPQTQQHAQTQQQQAHSQPASPANDLTPGTGTTVNQVVNTGAGKSNKGTSFAEAMKSAAALYNSLPCSRHS